MKLQDEMYIHHAADFTPDWPQKAADLLLRAACKIQVLEEDITHLEAQLRERED